MQQSGANRWFNDLRWLWWIVAAAWVLLLQSSHLHPHSSPVGIGWAIDRLAGWETMLASMMLPALIPVAQALGVVADPQECGQVQAAFLSAYLCLWSLFALLLVVVEGFGMVHTLGLETLTGKAVSLLVVGAFQFSPWKRACLRGCRMAIATVTQHYHPGWVGGWALGWQHGTYCLGCCWALMTEMTLLGLHSFGMMALFTGVMLVERFWKHGEAFAIVVGVVFIACAVFLAVQPIRFQATMHSTHSTHLHSHSSHSLPSYILKRNSY